MSEQLPLAIKLCDESTLTDFCWNNNALLHQQLHNALNGFGERLIYLWGGDGHGKSHILQACCHALIASQPAIYLPLNSLKTCGPDVLEGVDEQTWISLDDLDQIAQDTAWEEAIFHLYNRVRDNERTTLLISAKYPPSQIKIQLPDLQSRLAGSLVIQLNPLCDDDKLKTLKRYAQKRGFELPLPVAQFLLKRCARNMHDLNIILNRLDDASLIAQRKITIPFVKEVLDL